MASWTQYQQEQKAAQTPRDTGTTSVSTQAPVSSTQGSKSVTSPYTDTTITTPGDKTITQGPRTDVQTTQYGDQARTSSKTGVQTDTQTQTMESFIQNMDSQSLAALQALIKQLGGGGSPELKGQQASRRNALALVQSMISQVSQKRAQEDSQGMIQLLMQQAMEKNMPAIQRAVEGAGTSANSMQGLLSQQLARDASLAAGAAGTQQSLGYAQQRTALASVLENLTRVDDPNTTALLNALGIAKGATQQQTQSQTSTRTQSSQEDVLDILKRAADTQTTKVGSSTTTQKEAPTKQVTQGGQRSTQSSQTSNQGGQQSTQSIRPNSSIGMNDLTNTLLGMSSPFSSSGSGGLIMGGADAQQSALGQLGQYWNPNTSSIFDFLKR